MYPAHADLTAGLCASELPLAGNRGHAAGVTLLELVVVLAVLALLGAMTVGLWSRTDLTEDPAANASPLAVARQRALLRGVPVTVVVASEGREVDVTVLPDGRVVAPPGAGFEALGALEALPGQAPFANAAGS